jgi:hypothetical protein
MRKLTALIFMLILMVPSAAWANAGTAMMWHTAFHLYAGNIVIGLLEAGLLVWLWKASCKRAAVLMIIANFASFVAGFVGMNVLGVGGPGPIEDLRLIFMGTMAVAWLVTVLVEAPFVRWSLPVAGRSLRRTLLASLLLQTLTYGLLVLYYLSVSSASLAWRWEVVAPAALPLPPGIEIHYVHPDGARICALEGAETTCRALPGPGPEAPLSLGVFPVHPEAEDPGVYVLREGATGTALRTDLSPGQIPMVYEDALDPADAETWDQAFVVRRPATFVGELLSENRIPRLGDAWRSRIHVFQSTWRMQGLWFGGPDGVNAEQVALDTPIHRATFRRVYQIPGERLVVELDPEQICVMDLATHRIARIARGRSLVVLQRSGGGE